MGRHGAEILLQKLAWPGDQPWLPHRVALEPVLIVRESSDQGVGKGAKRPGRPTAPRLG